MVRLNVLSIAVGGILLTAMSILPEAPIPPLLRRTASLLDVMSTYRACWRCCLKFLRAMNVVAEKVLPSQLESRGIEDGAALVARLNEELSRVGIGIGTATRKMHGLRKTDY
jgi:hypothetical protein